MKRDNTWIQTYTGKKIYPLDPKPEIVCIEDIAHSLSLLCRYNGHCKYFYSVAEHSIHVSLHVPEEYALWGLLHDAAEAYLSDIPGPIKKSLKEYLQAEERMTKCIAERFNLSYPIPKEVKMIDTAILADEEKQVMGKPPQEWPQLKYPALGIVIWGLQPVQGERCFKDRFKEIIKNNI